MMRTTSQFKYCSRVTNTSHCRFRRIDHLERSRAAQTSKGPNLSRYSRGNLDSTKQNMSFECYLSKVQSAGKIDEESIVSSYLNNLRKDYDKLSKVCQQKQTEINIKRKQIDFMRDKNRNQRDRTENIEKHIETQSVKVSIIEEKHEAIKMERKVLNHVIERMKKDEIYYKLLSRTLNEKLSSKRKDLKALNEQTIHEDESIHKLFALLNTYKDSLMKNSETREMKFGFYRQKIQDIQEKDKFVQERKERTYELQSIESNDILNFKSIHMRELYMVHRVLATLLEQKINTLLQKYSGIQNAFHTIKTKTSIEDPNLLAIKFFSYEELTESLMQSISLYEKQLQKATARNNSLKGEISAQISQQFTEENAKKVENPDYQNIQSQCKKEIMSKQLQVQKIKNWISKMADMHKLSGNQQSREKQFAQLCRSVTNGVRQYEKTGNLMDTKYVAFGVRIKKLIRGNTEEEELQRKKEEKEIGEIHQLEEDHINVSHVRVKKQYQVRNRSGGL